ncbi:hypothetical protein PhaeoP75_02166 [Phaeobacter gallaeciensis]|uniref:Uncharacterized protein n=1 Tax=Phaeobacter gallaeciensis TaxID=60890 RepID=A0AAD0EBM7_9RHOB|nr:hypothetical protein Gal_02125 [Phaeobacter gallaeciensis DSM 26640]ATE93137.1 hypothetical protein PhaeoP11_02116 [Phaeobacter gallaeciensis]ATE97041.1 hypothetical protein PhaeoP73_01730 [Phaeobacter gallaeciensis]ATF01802.1 hypothetical protein PhaeoP75_02166 [Phaeobacter gallaeciensis]ATF06182.1 hypothetical protein PhaeoP63_02115 [Phaeobacter gallaeciensis]
MALHDGASLFGPSCSRRAFLFFKFAYFKLEVNFILVDIGT